MIHIIAGDKGKGKTKALIDKVNNEVKVVSGTVVFLDNNNKHLYELSNRVKMINCTSYGISKLDSFTGFVRGIISQNSDIEKIYIDNFKTVAYVGESHIVEALDAEFSALQSGSAELRTKLETLQPDVSALKNIRKYIDMVLNKQQLSTPGGKQIGRAHV